jgi:hypothetical protein
MGMRLDVPVAWPTAGRPPAVWVAELEADLGCGQTCSWWSTPPTPWPPRRGGEASINDDFAAIEASGILPGDRPATIHRAQLDICITAPLSGTDCRGLTIGSRRQSALREQPSTLRGGGVA